MNNLDISLLSSEERRKYYFEKNYRYDAELYYKFSATKESKFTKESHKAELIFYYHKIEKGLALKEPKPYFGIKAVNYLIDSLIIYSERYGLDKTAKIACANILDYFRFNEKYGLPEELKVLKEKFNRGINNEKVENLKEDEYGINIFKRMDIQEENNFQKLCNTRHSIRQFSKLDVEMDQIYIALKIAQTTPTVCNRQANRAYILKSKNKIKDALKFQNGNAGFENQINKLIVVTSELNDFITSNERNQPYIDGGMYAMTLIYALHSLGLGTCPLNLALDSDVDFELKKTLKIPENQVLIMMIAIGHIPDEIPVAASKRFGIEEVYKVIE
ncbi:MAG: nitroreductase family protein [Psychrobacillus psychrodurans]